MHSLDIIVTRNAAAAGREAALADNRGDHALAGSIFEADTEARRAVKTPVALYFVMSDAFVAAYCAGRDLLVKA